AHLAHRALHGDAPQTFAAPPPEQEPPPEPTVGLEALRDEADHDHEHEHEHEHERASVAAIARVLRPYQERLSTLPPSSGYTRRALRRILDAGDRVDSVPAFLRALTERNLDLDLARAETKDIAFT